MLNFKIENDKKKNTPLRINMLNLTFSKNLSCDHCIYYLNKFINS